MRRSTVPVEQRPCAAVEYLIRLRVAEIQGVEPPPMPEQRRQCPRCRRTLRAERFAAKSARCWLCEAAVRNERSGKLGHRQRARVGAHLTDAQWVAILLRFGYRCAYCGDPWQVVEHRVPASKGGGHGPDNVVPACARCNRRKGTETWEVRPPGGGPRGGPGGLR